MVVFIREVRTLGFANSVSVTVPELTSKPTDVLIKKTDSTVLVINSSHEMAKEITLQLTLKIPGCSITYAPTLELARYVLGRKKIDLIVSSPLLPDGSIIKLKDLLESMECPPDLLVVGNINVQNAENLSKMGYEYVTFKKLATPQRREQERLPIIHHKRRVDESIKTLGADIRNDLNNPLQEIVAMVFVAKATGESLMTSQALEAIDKAAQNLASIVSGLEDKIRGFVAPQI